VELKLGVRTFFSAIVQTQLDLVEQFVVRVEGNILLYRNEMGRKMYYMYYVIH